jgi:menaquinol-cytochrome c reductase iron-sulfur subunit
MNPASFPEELTPKRRDFLTTAIYGLMSLITAGLGLPALLYLFVPPRRKQEGAWVDAGTLEQLESDRPVEVTFRRNRTDGWKVFSEKASAWVVKKKDSQVTAFAPACTHLGCAYHWEDSRDQFVCPCHGSYFSIDGEVIAGPAPRPLDQFEVKLEGNRVWLGPMHVSQEKPA